MTKKTRATIRWVPSDNRKSKIEIENGGDPRHLFHCVLVSAGVQAQQPTKVPRIGYLSGASSSTIAARIEAFRQGLRELGYIEGKNIIIECRYAEGKARSPSGARGRASASQSGRASVCRGSGHRSC